GLSEPTLLNRALRRASTREAWLRTSST
ncbi:hypothetical protein D020_2094B, partial [Vibrio parahaemolyticus SBR10290]